MTRLRGYIAAVAVIAGGAVAVAAPPAAAAPLPTEFACSAFLPHSGDWFIANGSSYSSSANGWRCKAGHPGSSNSHWYMVCHYPDEPSPSYIYWWNPGFEAYHNGDCTT